MSCAALKSCSLHAKPLPDTAVSRLAARLSELAGAPVELDRPNDPQHGDYATNVAMQLAPVRKRSPRELGEELAAAAPELKEVERAEVAGPGFVNLWLAPDWFAEALGEMLLAGRDYGAGWAEPRQRVQVEMVSANPTGPLTVASARNGAYGDSVARLLEFAGHQLEREYYYNDAGAQMERFRVSVEAVPSGEATSSSSTISWTRSASTRRAGSSSTAGRTRRSRSTSTSRPSGRSRTRSTTSSTPTRGSRGSSGTPPAQQVTVVTRSLAGS